MRGKKNGPQKAYVNMGSSFLFFNVKENNQKLRDNHTTFSEVHV